MSCWDQLKKISHNLYNGHFVYKFLIGQGKHLLDTMNRNVKLDCVNKKMYWDYKIQMFSNHCKMV